MIINLYQNHVISTRFSFTARTITSSGCYIVISSSSGKLRYIRNKSRFILIFSFSHQDSIYDRPDVNRGFDLLRKNQRVLYFYFLETKTTQTADVIYILFLANRPTSNSIAHSLMDPKSHSTCHLSISPRIIISVFVHVCTYHKTHTVCRSVVSFIVHLHCIVLCHRTGWL